MNTLPKYDVSICLVHAFCNHQAIKILKNDTNTCIADVIKDFLGTINRGNSWSDQGFKNIHHFYNPKSKKGILGLTGADAELINYFDQALDAYKKKATSNFFFFIGAVMHIIQDMCVPHHVFGMLLKGHKEYEDWVVNHYMDYGIDAGAQYDYTSPLEIINSNAIKAMEYKELMDKSDDLSMRNEATRHLLGLAQKSTASFLYLCRNKIQELTANS